MAPNAYARWESRATGRYYEVRLQHDLFGELELQQTWGSLRSRRGGDRRRPLPDVSVWAAVFRSIDRRRAQHGYAITQFI